MNEEQMAKITQFVADNIGGFHQQRLNNIKKVKLNSLLRRCNPYFFKAKNHEIASDFVRELLNTSVNRGEQTIFGEFLESVAIFISGLVCGGKKVGTTGIDLEFEREGVYYIVSIKSGPNWGNSSATAKQKELFTKAARTIRQNKQIKFVRPVLGCCFGKQQSSDKGEFDRYCGQQFWDFLSGDKRLYIDIIEPLGYKAKENDEEFQKEYAKYFNLLLEDFIRQFCVKGEIDWEALVKFNAEHQPSKSKK